MEWKFGRGMKMEERRVHQWQLIPKVGGAGRKVLFRFSKIL